MTTFEGSQDGKGLRVGIVCSRFNEFIVSALLDGAKRGLANHGVSNPTSISHGFLVHTKFL